MSNFEPVRVSLEDLQGLAESFANLNVVDLKMNPEVKPEEEAEASEQRRRHTEGFRAGARFDEEHRRAADDAAMLGRRTRMKRPKLQDTPVGKATLEPLHPYGVMLDIDEVDFKDIEGLIDEWNSAMRIAAATLELEKDSFVKILETSLAGVVKMAWEQRMTSETKEACFTPNTFIEMADRMSMTIKNHFLGTGYFEGFGEEKRKKYLMAFYNLRLMVLEPKMLNKFFRYFNLYLHHSKVEEKLAMELFFLKFPSPWKEMLVQDYQVNNQDSVARRMSFVHKKLAEWCQLAATQRNMKRLRKINKSTPLNCEDNDLPTIIGDEPPRYQKRKKNRF